MAEKFGVSGPSAAHETPTPTVDVLGEDGNPLPIGKYLFSVVVVDSLGMVSAPDTVEVTVAAVPEVRFTKPSGAVPAGKPFTLAAEARSENGAITAYRWTRRR